MDWAKQPLTGTKDVLPHLKGRFAHSVVKIKSINCCYSSTLFKSFCGFIVIFLENDMSFTQKELKIPISISICSFYEQSSLRVRLPPPYPTTVGMSVVES